ncbi:hypothetical protein GEMRC1_003893 [Eukaryota sp. GEM-RC1]
MLIKYAVTRFYTHFLSLSRIYELREAVVETLTDPLFENWVKKQNRDQRGDYTALQNETQNLFFWNQVKQIISFWKPVVVFLQMVDSEAQYISRIVPTIATVRSEIGTSFPTFLSETERNEILKAYDTRISMLLTPIQYVAFLLDPKHFEAVMGLGQSEQMLRIMASFYSLCSKLLEKGDAHICESELTAYLTNGVVLPNDMTSFAQEIAEATEFIRTLADTISPGEWWEKHGSGYPRLQKIAIITLSQISSTSFAERNFSTESMVQTKLRNRMKTSTLSALTHIAFNERLLQCT